MIANQKCDTCTFQDKCVAYKKLKPSSEDARVDLGVDLTFDGCGSYMPIQDDEAGENSDN